MAQEPAEPVGHVVLQMSPVRQMVVAVRPVEKRFVVVAEVPVALTKVKFVKVEEEETKRLVVVAVPKTVRP